MVNAVEKWKTLKGVASLFRNPLFLRGLYPYYCGAFLPHNFGKGSQLMLIAIAVAAFALGGVWVYVVPQIQTALNGVLPANVTGNKYAQVATAGLMILASVWIVSLIAKGFIKKAGA